MPTSQFSVAGCTARASQPVEDAKKKKKRVKGGKKNLI